ncbi:MAG: S9 family peptidase [Bacteroidota bacterium]|nr:S9 family peptidase [Bacteroidota bacterium]
MKRLLMLMCLLAIIAGCHNKSEKYLNYKWPDVKPPVCEKKPQELIAHGDKRIDNYFWLNDFFKKGPDSRKVVAYLKAENNYLYTMMKGLKSFQDNLYTEMRSRIKEKDESVPYFKNGYYYYTRIEEGQEYGIFCRKRGSLNAREEIMLDMNAMAKGHPYFVATGFDVSQDNKKLVYGVDIVSRRQYTIYVKNLTSGKTSREVAGETDGNPVWAADNKTFFYVKNNAETLLSEKIMKHKIGTPEASDKIVYTEKDPSNYINVWRSKSDKYIFITSAATMSSETRYISSSKPEADFKVFQPRIKNVLYSVEHLNNKFIVLTNLDALNFRLMETDLDNTSRENWKEVIPHRKDVLLEAVEPFKNFMVITERKNGLVQFRIRNLSNHKDTYMPFEEPTYMASFGTNPEFNAETLRYNYTSLTTPPSVFDYNLRTGAKKLMKEQEVLGGFSKKDYVTERVFATAKDGTKIPISLVYKKGFKKDGKSPMLLYGYGSYGISMDASFSSPRLSLLNRGVIYALAHIRGGEEMGRSWYENGKLMHKMNTFTDFIACAEFLDHEKYSSPRHTYAMGGSAGGLLMGAITNLRPDLWNGVIAQVPFVDVLTTMSDPTIPLTTNEYDEWGNPANNEAYHYIKSYSPYDNVKKKSYPNLLVMTGLHDSQVQYFEPAKWVAKLRELKTDHNLLLLHTDMSVGHGGASGRFKYLKDIALEYSFVLALEGITK